MTYAQIMQQTDYNDAIRVYLKGKFGQDALNTFPILSGICLRALIAGKPESMFLAEVLAGFGLKPL